MRSLSKRLLSPDLDRQSKGINMRQLFAGLAAAAFLMLGVSGTAHAQQAGVITCNEGGNPPNQTYTGTLTITQDGDCTLDAVTATGGLNVSATGKVTLNGPINAQSLGVSSGATLTVNGAITTDSSSPITLQAENTGVSPITYFDVNITSGASFSTGGSRFTITGKNITSAITLQSPTITSNGGGTITLSSLQGYAQVTNTAGDIVVNGSINGTDTLTGIKLSAGQSLGVGNITVSGPISAVEPYAPAVSIVGGGSVSLAAITAPSVLIEANQYGITGSNTLTISSPITAAGPSGAGGSIGIYNGSVTGGGVGNISISDALNLKVSGTTGNTLTLSAFGGTLSLPGGTIDVPGALPVLWFQASTVHTTADTTLSVTIPSGSASKHKLRIDADNITYDGDLNLLSNGAGTSSNNGFVYLASYSHYYSLSTPDQIHFSGGTGKALSMQSNGNYNYVELSADHLTFDGAGPVILQSQGLTSHSVKIQNTAPASGTELTLNNTGSFLMDSSAAVGGAGSSLTVNIGSLTVHSSSLTLNANGPISGNGNGGTISYTALSTSILPTSYASVQASGALNGTGNANTASAINFKSGSPFTLGVLAGEISMSANGGTSGGTAGKVTIDAGAGNEVNVDVPTLDSGGPVISAVAKGSSAGGTIIISATDTFYEVNRAFKVDAGPSSAVSQQDGSISLNGIPCGQWKIGTGNGNSVWPFTYWNCVNPTAPGDIDSQPSILANSMSLSTIASTFGTQPVQLYVFPAVTDAETFYKFGTGIIDAGGFTFQSPVSSTIFTNVVTNGLTIDQHVQELTAHELGHAADYSYMKQSTTGDYLTYVATDFAFLDYYQLEDSPEDSAPYLRNPCVGTVAPFAGLSDESTGQAFCVSTETDGYTLIPGSNPATYIESQYIPGGVLMRNSQIAQASTPDFTWDNVDNGWFEPYAQSFAFEAYAKSLSQSLYYAYTTDNLFKNQWFACTLSWADDVLANATVPPTTAPAPYSGVTGFGACDYVPDWYREQLGH